MTWVFASDSAHEDDRHIEIGGAACWYCVICAHAFCRRKEAERRKRGERLDFIPKAAALTLFADPAAADHVATALRVGLWEETDGGFVIVDYASIYKQGASSNAPAADQQRKLTERQLEARRQGGRARAETSRSAAGRFQQKTSSAPATDDQQSSSCGPASRASHSGSGSGSDPDFRSDPTDDVRSASDSNAREADEATTAGDGGKTESEPDRETICPLDLLDRDGVKSLLVELSKKLSCPIAWLEHEAREFVTYWTMGGGVGQRKAGWPKHLRTRLARRHAEGEITEPRVRGRGPVPPVQQRDMHSVNKVIDDAREAARRRSA